MSATASFEKSAKEELQVRCPYESRKWQTFCHRLFGTDKSQQKVSTGETKSLLLGSFLRCRKNGNKGTKNLPVPTFTSTKKSAPTDFSFL